MGFYINTSEQRCIVDWSQRVLIFSMCSTGEGNLESGGGGDTHGSASLPTAGFRLVLYSLTHSFTSSDSDDKIIIDDNL